MMGMAVAFGAAADAHVEKALFQRAIGYLAPDCHVSQYEGRITITPLEKHHRAHLLVNKPEAQGMAGPH
jgi:hypothetical protein